MKIGLLNDFVYIPGRNSVFGHDTAVNNMLEMFAKYAQGELAYLCGGLETTQNKILNSFLMKTVEGYAGKNITFLNDTEDTSHWDLDLIHSVTTSMQKLLHYREANPQKTAPIVHTCHCTSYRSFVTEYLLMILFSQEVDSIVCTTQSAARALKKFMNFLSDSLEKNLGIRKRYAGRVDIIPLGYNERHVHPVDSGPARKKHGLAEKDYVLLWLGRFSAYDKADLLPLMMVVKRLVEKNPGASIKLVLAGNDNKVIPYLPSMQNAIETLGLQNNVLLLDGMDIDQRAELYSMSDVFVSLADNLQETFGLTPIEAMACGTPQVVSDWDGYQETVVHGVTGYHIPCYWTETPEPFVLPASDTDHITVSHYVHAQSVYVDLDVLESVLQRLLDNEDLRKRLSENSIAHAKTFAWEGIIPQYFALWKELIQQAGHTQARSLYPIVSREYKRIFEHYPTGFLSMEQQVSPTEDIALYKDAIRYPYVFTESLFQLDVDTRMIEANGLLETKKPVSIQALLAQSEIEYTVGMRSIMRMLKHGMLRLHTDA